MSDAGLQQNAEPPGRVTGRRRLPTAVWPAVWLLATLINGAIIISVRQLDQPSAVKGSVAVVAQLAATVALLVWLGAVPPRAWWLLRRPGAGG